MQGKPLLSLSLGSIANKINDKILQSAIFGTQESMIYKNFSIITKVNTLHQARTCKKIEYPA